MKQPSLPLDSLGELSADPRLALIAEALGGAELFLVGGCVRDHLLGRSSGDLDLAVNVRPEEMITRFQKAGIKVIPTGLQHQTITVVPIVEQPALELTTFRSAGISATQASSFGSSIEEDLRYRDFTINAMAVAYQQSELIDPLNGLADVKAKCIRCVGDPVQRFTEDPLRIVRMVRIAVQLGFDIDNASFDVARTSLALLQRIAIERFRDEFTKILLSPQPARGLRLLSDLGVLELFIPELQAMVGFEQNDFHHLDLFEHSLAVLEGCPPELTLRLAALFHDLGKISTLSVDEQGQRHFYKHEHVGATEAKEVLTRLLYSHRLIRDVVTLIQTHMRPLTAGAAGVRRILRDTEGLYPQWRELKIRDAEACLFDTEVLAKQLTGFDAQVAEIQSQPDVSPLRNLAINGNDLLALGFSAGPGIGNILRTLHEEVLDSPEKNQKEYLLRRAKEIG